MHESANTAIVGTIGTVATLTLAQFNVLVGSVAGVLTVIYVALGIWIRWKNRHRKDGE